jgi:Phytanoyl-CoA dioxygenase (PhyH)
MISAAVCPEARQLEDKGFVIIENVLSADQVDEVLRSLGRALSDHGSEGPISSQAGTLYAARNVLRLWPAAARIWRSGPLPELLAHVLGPRFGLVRGLYFDKPPGQTWALPWHKDLTIAVRDNRLPSASFERPTRKAGVPHVEAPEEVLCSMLTIRLHLDEATEENGPLRVIPGSHHTGKELTLGATPPITVLTGQGAALLMRPLLAHSSGRSLPDTGLHRRVLHLEFAASSELPDGYAWHTFLASQ